MTGHFVTLFSFVVLAISLTLAGCADPVDGEGEGVAHSPGCDEPLFNDDFLGESLDAAWIPRSGTTGGHELTSEGVGADRHGYLVIRDGDAHADIAPSDRSAYGLTRPLQAGDAEIRAMLVEAPTDPLHTSGILVELDQENLVAVSVRGVDDLVQGEMWSFVNGEFRVGGSGSLTNPAQVLLELSRRGDEWTATVNGTEVGHGEIALSGDLRVGPFVGSPIDQVAEVKVEWIEGC